MPKIISNKKYKEIEIKEKMSEFMSRSIEANLKSLNYQSAIISIMEKMNIKEIELDNSELYFNRDKEISLLDNPINHTKILRIK